jgi:hypothetical protein
VIHADLVWANASSWSWWLSVSANDFKDGLIYIFNKDQKGEKDINKLDATLFDSKLLWALGNYSRFVRPKMKRVEVHIDQEKCKISAFKDKNQLVLVLVNQGEAFQLQLPKIPKTKTIHSFTTSESKNLAFEPVNSKMCQIPNQSIVTFVYEIR